MRLGIGPPGMVEPTADPDDQRDHNRYRAKQTDQHTHGVPLSDSGGGLHCLPAPRPPRGFLSVTAAGAFTVSRLLPIERGRGSSFEPTGTSSELVGLYGSNCPV